MKKRTAEEVLIMSIENSKISLDELSVHDEFSNGQRHAFVEQLEVLQKWERAEEFGLTGNIEDKYPLK